MPISENKDRVYVTLSRDMLAKIEHYSSMMGLSRSAFCAYCIGQSVMAFENATSAWAAVKDELVKNAPAIVTKGED